MDGEGVAKIADLVGRPAQLGNLIVRPEGWVIDDPASLVKPGPQPAAMVLHSLGALRDYVKANRDALNLETVVVHVVSPKLVTVSSALDARSRTRETYVSAQALDMGDGFLGRFMPLEEFVLGLQIRFADADNQKDVLRVLGNVKSESVKQAVDDGVTQSVQVKSGVTLVSDAVVPNPVLLCPFRTFRDVVQPSSLFVLRLHGKPGDLPQAGLFEADGGVWRLTAVERIRNWLADALPDGVAVLA